MKKYYAAVLFVISSSLTIVLFQNCAQPGDLALVQSPDYMGKATGEPIDNDLPIDDSGQTVGQDQPPALEVVPVIDIPNDTMIPPIVSDADGTNTMTNANNTNNSNTNTNSNTGTTSTTTTSNTNTNTNTTTIDTQPPVVITTDPKTLDPVIKDPDVVLEPPVVVTEEPKVEDTKPPVVVTEDPKIDDVKPPVVISEEPTIDEEAVAAAACRNMEPSDILLMLTGIGINQSSGNFEIVGTKQISLLQSTVRIRALKSLNNVRSLRLDFDAEKSYLLDSSKALYTFKAPSAENSGLKLQLDSALSMDKNKTYDVTVTLDLDRQLVANSNKCIFKPVIKSGSIAATQ